MMLSSCMRSAVLGLLLSLSVSVASPPKTFDHQDPITGKPVTCDRCPPGTYLSARCSSTQRSQCAPCPSGSFTELWNHISKCLRCGVCGHNMIEKTACTANTDCQCECKPGYFFKEDYEMCVRHSECPAGQGVESKGTANANTVCHVCSNNTYSDVSSAHLNCTQHQTCSDAELLKGSTWHNSVCATCSELKDGGEYLKEILAPFFVHHKMNIKRLRRVVHRLPSEDGKRQPGTSELNLSELRDRINTWAATATPKQIRELPGILENTGASGVGERLQNKLQRIDTNLKEQCSLGNEVHVVL
ncbi:tumor necrosis factor receptor superfamily member 6B-like isoform X2 [Stegastes partitus]|uniref:Tumor necrosis factor receptor superfamily member 6B-like n=1 Tax=Stegastes partitus TaxID=144197 RepID=A0A3B5BB08_9TELE|nr:PREDICTED: tumor necrosis factor receptor superfamily member 6B-like isoform X2 [Stegastes partitus]